VSFDSAAAVSRLQQLNASITGCCGPCYCITAFRIPNTVLSNSSLSLKALVKNVWSRKCYHVCVWTQSECTRGCRGNDWL